MLAHLRRSIVLAVVALVLTFAYAYAGTGVSQLFFKHQADGSLIADGSTLIGQNWAEASCPGHPLGSCVFHGRPDDTGPYAANPKKDIPGGDNPLEACSSPSPSSCVAGESGGTSLGPRSKILLEDTKELVAYWHKLGVDPTPDLVTTSGSGYDPDITPQDAIVQVGTVSSATGIPASRLRALIAKETNGEQLGFLGSRFIDVLQLNNALAKLK